MSARIISAELEGGVEARKALEACVASGGIAVFPADGVYGLCCDPLDPEAIERIHGLKGRDESKSSAILYFSPLAMRELLAGMTPRVAGAVGRLLPGALTLILPNPEGRYPLACREDPERLGVRLLEGPLAGMPLPIFQTSANLSRSPAVSEFGQIDDSIISQVDLAIDGGALQGEPSTVVDLSQYESHGEWKILREGAFSRDRLDGILEDGR